MVRFFLTLCVLFMFCPISLGQKNPGSGTNVVKELIDRDDRNLAVINDVHSKVQIIFILVVIQISMKVMIVGLIMLMHHHAWKIISRAEATLKLGEQYANMATSATAEQERLIKMLQSDMKVSTSAAVRSAAATVSADMKTIPEKTAEKTVNKLREVVSHDSPPGDHPL